MLGTKMWGPITHQSSRTKNYKELKTKSKHMHLMHLKYYGNQR